jgi:hypothetical protein
VSFAPTAIPLRDPAWAWSLGALGAGAFGAALDAILIVSIPGEDLSELNWPVILLPALFVPAPVLWSRGPVRVLAAVGMLVWCWLTGFSLGPMFVPCLVLMIVAAVRTYE